MTPFAQWLNTAFSGFDYSILQFFHVLATHAASVLTPLSEFFAFIGDGALACFALAAILLLFPKTRKAGFCIMLAVGVGALITNVAIKNLVERPRPFAIESGVEQFRIWWEYVGSPEQGEFSFPSGHTTAAMAGAMGLCLGYDKNRKWWIFISSALYVILMGASRNYLMVHYPTDILGGLISGAIGGGIAYLLISFLYKGLEGNRDSRVCSFILDANVKDLFKKKT